MTAARRWNFCAAFFWPLLAAFSLAILPQRSSGIGSAVLEIGDIQGSGWSASGISVQLALPPQGAALARIAIDRFTLAALPQPFRRILITCRDPQTAQPKLRCRNGVISGNLGPLGKQDLRADLTYDTHDHSLRFEIRNVKLAGGSLGLQGQWLQAGWRVAAQARAVQLKSLLALATPWFKLPTGYSVEGKGSVQLTLSGRETAEKIQAQADIAGLTANNAEGSLATDQLGLKLDAQLQATRNGWRIAASVQSDTGQAYVDPVFVELTKNPLKATLDGEWLVQPGELQIDSAVVDQTGIAKGSAKGRLAFAGPVVVRDLELCLESLEFPGAYTALMQPFLLTTDFKELATRGRISGTAVIADGAPARLDLKVEDVTALDKQGKVGIEGLHGHFAWRSASTELPASTPATSWLAWSAANAYGLSGGAARLDFSAAGADFQLLKPALIPVLDGGLFIRTLGVQKAGTEQMSLRFEGELQPISMPLLCRAFGWPEFSGTISGHIPEVAYAGGNLSVGGALQANAFGGRLTVDGLELREPLGQYPRMKADIVLRGLDLEAVTGTFSFGSITGRLDGEIRDLELFNWEPIRMDARLYTPAGDKSRHLISQRAVNNLSSIGGGGGGVAAALQSGFLRFFKNFRYKRLGLSCRLENEVCRMNGVAPAANGNSYYIVQGSGIPRIDIIGNAREVDWSRLVAQLKAIQTSGGPVVR